MRTVAKAQRSSAPGGGETPSSRRGRTGARSEPAASVRPQAWFALGYLIVAGSIIGFTAYTWLIHHESPTKVGTYAYVNPVVAVLIGYFLGDEPLGLRTVLGTLLVLVSVIVITTAPSKKRVAALPAEDAA